MADHDVEVVGLPVVDVLGVLLVLDLSGDADLGQILLHGDAHIADAVLQTDGDHGFKAVGIAGLGQQLLRPVEVLGVVILLRHIHGPVAHGGGNEAGHGGLAVVGEIDDLLAVQGIVDGLAHALIGEGLALAVHEQAHIVPRLIADDLDGIVLPDELQHGGISHDEVHGAGAQGIQPGGGVGHDIELDGVEGRLAGLVEVFVEGVDGGVVVRHILAQGVGAGAAVGLQQAAFVGLDDILIHDGAVAAAHIAQEGDVDVLQGDVDSGVIHDFDGIDVAGVAAGVAQGAEIGIQHALEGVLDVLGGHLPPGVEVHVIRQMEGVGEVVLGDLPAGGELGHDFQILIHIDQLIVHLGHDADGGMGGDGMGIEAGGLGLRAIFQHVVLSQGAGYQAQRQSEGQNQRQKLFHGNTSFFLFSKRIPALIDIINRGHGIYTITMNHHSVYMEHINIIRKN